MTGQTVSDHHHLNYFASKFILNFHHIANCVYLIKSVGALCVSEPERIAVCCRYPMPYKAYFMAGSDSEFTVSPATGELLPVDTAGSLICISFTPLKYGKVHQGRLVIQVRGHQ